MFTLRSHLDAARREYRRARYPGDLVAELLIDPADDDRRHRMMQSFWGRTLAFVAAVAALAAVAFALNYRPHKPGFVGPTPTVAPITSPGAAQPWEPLVDHIKQVHYGRYVDGVTSGMKDAVAQITGGVDEAIDSPLVAGTAKTARQVAGEFGQVFADIGSQLRPRLQ
jgi:hypothetical protein